MLCLGLGWCLSFLKRFFPSGGDRELGSASRNKNKYSSDEYDLIIGYRYILGARIVGERTIEIDVAFRKSNNSDLQLKTCMYKFFFLFFILV